MILYLSTLFILAFYFHTGEWKSYLKEKDKVLGWNISFMDFMLFMWICFCSCFVFQIIGGAIFKDSILPPLTTAIVSSLILQLPLLITLVFYITQKKEEFGSIFKVTQTPWKSLIPQTLFLFVKQMPLLFVVAFCWNQILEFLASQGWIQPPEKQFLVQIIQSEGISPSLLFLILLSVTLAPITEEILFRGAIYTFLKSRYPLYAIWITSIAFALIHRNLASFVPLVYLGYQLNLCYEKTGDLRSSIIFHSAFNAQSVTLLILFPEVNL